MTPIPDNLPDMVASGLTIKDISVAIGIHSGRLYAFARQNKIPVRKDRRKAILAALAECPETATDLAQFIGLSVNRTRAILLEMRLEKRVERFDSVLGIGVKPAARWCLSQRGW